MNRRRFFRAVASAPFLSIAAPAALGVSFAAGGSADLMPAVLGKMRMSPPISAPTYVVGLAGDCEVTEIIVNGEHIAPLTVEVRRRGESEWRKLPPIHFRTVTPSEYRHPSSIALVSFIP